LPICAMASGERTSSSSSNSSPYLFWLLTCKHTRRLFGEYGSKWSMIGVELDRFPGSCRDKWRDIKADYQKGAWSPAEDAQLIELVRKSSRAEEAPRSNINWTAISDVFKTRSHGQCRKRWYNVLYPKMASAAQGKPEYWLSDDDRELLQRLYDCGAEDDSEVNWAAMSTRYHTDACRDRWKRLLLYVPNWAHNTFEQNLSALRETLSAQDRQRNEEEKLAAQERKSSKSKNKNKKEEKGNGEQKREGKAAQRHERKTKPNEEERKLKSGQIDSAEHKQTQKQTKAQRQAKAETQTERREKKKKERTTLKDAKAETGGALDAKSRTAKSKRKPSRKLLDGSAEG